MKRKKDIYSLLEEIQELYQIIISEYEKSLSEKIISNKLKVKIKSFFEHSRSALDYAAHDVADSLGINRDVIYFPIVEGDKDIQSYEGAIGRNLPGLKNKAKNIFDSIEKVQPYNSGYEWMADFSTVSNDHKHQKLSEQKRVEQIRIISSTQSGMVSWNPSAVTFGNGVFINGAQVDPANQLPIHKEGVEVKKEIWVDFLFLGKVSALNLIKKIKDELPKIVNSIYRLLETYETT